MVSLQLPNFQSLPFSDALCRDVKKIALVLGDQVWPTYSQYFTAISNSDKNPVYAGKSLADESIDVLQCKVGLESQELGGWLSFFRTGIPELLHLKNDNICSLSIAYLC